jgi:ornithine carbamoyltransferase
MTVKSETSTSSPARLRGRSLLKELDLTSDELLYLVQLSADLKAEAGSGRGRRRLEGRKIALVFEKTSTRTRCAFEVAAYDQGAHVTYLGPDSSQIGQKESIRDTARVLGRMYDAIEYRGFGQAVVEDLAANAGVPVYNGLSDQFHPTQMLADMLTMHEHSGRPLDAISYCYLGDARFNTGNSLMVTGCMLGMDVRLCAPSSLWPDPGLAATARSIAAETGARLTLTADVDEAVRGVDFLYTDVWLSMGEDPAAWRDRIPLLRPYQVNGDVVRRTGNERVQFMHCLPAFHDRRTAIGERIHEEFGLDALEVTDEVFESPRSIVFDQAENRLHSIKAVLVATLAEPEP